MSCVGRTSCYLFSFAISLPFVFVPFLSSITLPFLSCFHALSLSHTHTHTHTRIYHCAGCLKPGASLWTADGSCRAHNQYDNNFVVTCNHTVVWSTNTTGQGVGRATLWVFPQGKLAYLDASGNSLWQVIPQISGTGWALTMQADGNLCYRSGLLQRVCICLHICVCNRVPSASMSIFWMIRFIEWRLFYFCPVSGVSPQVWCSDTRVTRDVLALNATKTCGTPPCAPTVNTMLRTPHWSWLTNKGGNCTAKVDSTCNFKLVCSGVFLKDQEVWASKTAGRGGANCFLRLSPDNSLTLVDPDNKNTVVWDADPDRDKTSRSVPQSVNLTLLDSGNLVLWDANSTVIWSSGSRIPSPWLSLLGTMARPLANTLSLGQSLFSANGMCEAQLQAWDSDLVVKCKSFWVPRPVPLWSLNQYLEVFQQGSRDKLETTDPTSAASFKAFPNPNSGNTRGTKLVLLPSGNLNLQNDAGAISFSTGTKGSSAYLVMQNDGNLVLYDALANQALWATNTTLPAGPFATLPMRGNLTSYNNLTLSRSTVKLAKLTQPYRYLMSPNGLCSLKLSADYQNAVRLFCKYRKDGTGPVRERLIWRLDAPQWMFSDCLVCEDYERRPVGTPPFFLSLQFDGNLMLKDSKGQEYFASNTGNTDHPNKPPYWLSLSNDGRLELFAQDMAEQRNAINSVIWGQNVKIDIKKGGQSYKWIEYLAALVDLKPLPSSDCLCASVSPFSNACRLLAI
jgi:hypothetical protein